MKRKHLKNFAWGNESEKSFRSWIIDLVNFEKEKSEKRNASSNGNVSGYTNIVQV